MKSVMVNKKPSADHVATKQTTDQDKPLTSIASAIHSAKAAAWQEIKRTVPTDKMVMQNLLSMAILENLHQICTMNFLFVYDILCSVAGGEQFLQVHRRPD